MSLAVVGIMKNATKLNTLLVPTLLDKNVTTNARVAVSVLSTSASCMQNKKVLKMAKWECGLMEMWAAVPKKARYFLCCL